MDINESKLRHQQHEANMGYWKGAFDEKFDDTKRHHVMLASVLPLVELLNPLTILTIGDNRGRDAAFFKSKLGCHVTASDLDTSKLEPAVLDGFIDSCKIIDVEKIELSSNSVDLVIVKESFHHWPRPMLGFYEILRVSKLGVILIEPYDVFYGEKNLPYLSGGDYSDQYEEVGNYLYRISLREIIKSAWSLYLDKVVAIGFNDPYGGNFQFDQWVKDKEQLDLLGLNGHRQFNLMSIFVEKVNNNIDYELALPSFREYRRPVNSFLK